MVILKITSRIIVTTKQEQPKHHIILDCNCLVRSRISSSDQGLPFGGNQRNFRSAIEAIEKSVLCEILKSLKTLTDEHISFVIPRRQR